jgi:hypothetical protein
MMREQERSRELEKVAMSAGAGGATSINYSGTILEFNSEAYIRREDVNGLLKEAARRSQAQVAKSMKNDPAFRRSFS